MATTVHIPVTSAGEGYDLVQALSVRGFAAVVIVSASDTAVELHSRYESLEHLLADLVPVLDDWRADRRHGALSVQATAWDDDGAPATERLLVLGERASPMQAVA